MIVYIQEALCQKSYQAMNVTALVTKRAVELCIVGRAVFRVRTATKKSKGVLCNSTLSWSTPKKSLKMKKLRKTKVAQATFCIMCFWTKEKSPIKATLRFPATPCRWVFSVGG